MEQDIVLKSPAPAAALYGLNEAGTTLAVLTEQVGEALGALDAEMTDGDNPFLPNDGGLVLRRVSGGQEREIARLTGITEGTVKGHVSNILSKLHLQDRTQAALFAVRHNAA